jgi:hypothetical protein
MEMSDHGTFLSSERDLLLLLLHSPVAGLEGLQELHHGPMASMRRAKSVSVTFSSSPVPTLTPECMMDEEPWSSDTKSSWAQWEGQN